MGTRVVPVFLPKCKTSDNSRYLFSLIRPEACENSFDSNC